MENSSNNNFPIEIKDVESKKAEELMKYFTGKFALHNPSNWNI